jgi:cytochrome P450
VESLNMSAVELPDTESRTLPLAGIDVSPHGLFETGEVLPLFAKLRREDPVHYCAESAYGPYWSLTRYEDIVKVDMNHKAFSSSYEHGGITLDDELARPPVEGFVMSSIILLDEPLHTPYRKAVQRVASPPALNALKDLVRRRTVAVLESLPRGEEFNWVDLVSIELTTQMLATLFDFPFEDRRMLRHWSDVTTAVEGTTGFVSHEHRVAELSGCLQYFTRLWNERVNAPPQFDLVSMLAHDPNTRHMTPMDYLSQVLVLIVGGNDTTRNTMSASINALHQFPDEFRKLRQDRGLIDNFIKEIIRWQTPVPHQRRTALQEVTLRGKTIRKGDKVAMWYYSGNRDEAVFPDGDRVRIDRPNARDHLSFGFGIHRCMGLRIAELQLRILWEEMLERFAAIELVREPKRIRSNLINGYSEVMVRVR